MHRPNVEISFPKEIIWLEGYLSGNTETIDQWTVPVSDVRAYKLEDNNDIFVERGIGQQNGWIYQWSTKFHKVR